MLKKPTELKLQNWQWLGIYQRIKNRSSYKFMYSDIDTYVLRVNKMTGGLNQHPSLFLQPKDHNMLLHELKLNFLKLIDDVSMLDLPNLAMCMQYVFDKLLQCLREFFNNYINLVQLYTEEMGLNQTRYAYQSKCTECQQNLHKVKINGLVNRMTLGGDEPSIAEIKKGRRQIEDEEIDFEAMAEGAEMTIMFNEILSKKENVLGLKNKNVSNIYDEIAQYLESIPQSTLNMSKEPELDKNLSLVESHASNFSEEISQGFESMFRPSIRKMVDKIIETVRKQLNKPKKVLTISTQTFILNDEQTIKNLQKSNEQLRKQVEAIKKAKTQEHIQMLKLLQGQKLGDIHLSQYINKCSFLEERLQKTSNELEIMRIKFENAENSKKQMSQKLVNDYVTQKSLLLKAIKQLQTNLSNVNHELSRLRKQTQNLMISESVQADLGGRWQSESKKTDYDNDNGTKISISSKKAGRVPYVSKKTEPDSNTFEMNFNLIEYKADRNIEKMMKISEQRRKSKLRQRVQFFREDRNLQMKKRASIEGMVEKDAQASSTKKIQKSSKSKLKLQSKGLISLKSNLSQTEILQKSSKKIKFKQTEIRQSQASKASIVSQKYLRPESRKRTSNFKTNVVNSCPSEETQAHPVQQLKGVLISSHFKQSEREERTEIVNRLMEKFTSLKQKGVLNKIEELISNLVNEEKQKVSVMSPVVLKQKSTNQKSYRKKQIVQQRQKNHYNKIIKDIKEIASLKPIEIKIEKFTKAQVTLLFGSIEYAKKFETRTQVWGSIENSLMLDNNFMVLCDSIELFLGRLRTENLQFYLQLCHFVSKPLSYVQGIKDKTESKQQQGRKLHKRYGSEANQKRIFQRTKQYENLHPQLMRQSFHNFLRFHKLIHKKCGHVEEFLCLIGFQM